MENKIPVNNLKEMMEHNTKLFGNKNAFLIKGPEKSYKGITYSVFNSHVDALGTALINLGLKGTHIAVIGENRYEWCVSYLAAVNGVGVVVPLDKELPPVELQNHLLKSECSAIIYSDKLSKEITDISSTIPSLKFLVQMDYTGNHCLADSERILSPDSTYDKQVFLSFSQLIDTGFELMKKGDRNFLDAAIDSDAMSILLFTSGTTDFAKGVMLSHRNICFDITAVLSTVHIDSNDSSLSILPIHHTYECSLGFLALMYSGSTVSFCEGLKYISKNLVEAKPTVLITVPLLLENMYKKIWDQASKKFSTKLKLKFGLIISKILYSGFRIDIRKKLFRQIHDSLGGKLRLIITGAAAIDPNVSKGLRDMGFKTLQGYGLTECSPLAIGNRDNMFKDSSVGLPLPGVEIKIDNPDEKGIGELLVKGKNVMLGYYNNPEATKKVLKEGWLYTGDLGYKDKSGFYYITGRKKNVIVTKNGKNIFPEEIESYINKSMYVAESVVLGSYDEATGETSVIARIVPNFNSIKDKLKLSTITKEDVIKVLKEEIKLVNKNMPLYKRIKDFSINENEFIKTTTKKIKRYLVS